MASAPQRYKLTGDATSSKSHMLPQALSVSEDIDTDWDTYTYEYGWKGRLAFRVYNVRSAGINGSSGFYPGSWTGSDPPPLVRSSPDFYRAADSHFAYSNFPSPFVSMWTSMRATFRYALWSGNCRVAVINMDVLGTSQGLRPRLHPVASIAKRYKDMRYTYKLGMDVIDHEGARSSPTLLAAKMYGCRVEWLYDGYIPRKAIITDFAVEDVRAFAVAHPEVDNTLSISNMAVCTSSGSAANFFLGKNVRRNISTGRAVGLLLKFIGMPWEASEKLAMKIVNEWKFRGTPKRDSPRKYKEGLYRGFRKGVIVGSSPIKTTRIMRRVPPDLHDAQCGENIEVELDTFDATSRDKFGTEIDERAQDGSGSSKMLLGDEKYSIILNAENYHKSPDARNARDRAFRGEDNNTEHGFPPVFWEVEEDEDSEGEIIPHTAFPSHQKDVSHTPILRHKPNLAAFIWDAASMKENYMGNIMGISSDAA